MVNFRHSAGRQSKADEKAFKGFIAQHNMTAESGRDYDPYDFLLYDFGIEVYRAVAEVKRLGKECGEQHDDTVMPFHKFVDCKTIAKTFGIDFYFYIIRDDEFFYGADLTHFRPKLISKNGRKDRGDPNDIMHLVHIPLAMFEKDAALPIDRDPWELGEDIQRKFFK